MKRLPGETFAEYRERRKKEREDNKSRLKGKVFWNSSKDGTYKREHKKEGK